MRVCADINRYTLVRKYRGNYIQSNHMHRKGVYPRSVSENICAETSGSDLLDHSFCYLDQHRLLYGDHLGFDISMYSKGKDMAPIYPGSMHESRCPDRELGLLERHLRCFHLSPSPSLHLAFTNPYQKESRCLGGVCDWTIVYHLFTRLFETRVLTVCSACVSSVCRLVYSVKSLRTLDKLYAFQQFGMWGYVSNTYTAALLLLQCILIGTQVSPR